MGRGQGVLDTGAPITVPVGEPTLGRIINIIGEPIDELGPIETNKHYAIHRPAPTFTEMGTGSQQLLTGIKVVDLLAPYAKGGKIGLFGGAGVGKTVFIMELIKNVKMYFSSLTTSSVSLKLVPKYLLCWVVFHLLSVTNQPWPLTWVLCRNVLPPPRKDPSPPYKLSMYLLTILLILAQPPPSPILTPPLSCLDRSLNWVSTQL